MTMSDIDMKLIGLYKFEIYYNEQDGEIEHGAVQGEIKFWKKHDDDTEKVERVYADERLNHLYLRDLSRIEVKKDP